MVALGFGVAWVGYAASLYGYVLVKGYDVTFKQLVAPKNYYAGKWPPAPIPDGQLWPSGKTGAKTTGKLA